MAWYASLLGTHFGLPKSSPSSSKGPRDGEPKNDQISKIAAGREQKSKSVARATASVLSSPVASLASGM